MGGSTPATGPDLRHHIPRLADGEHVVGQVDGQPVLVVNRGGELLAVSASCTHYGGPLGEGLLQGDTVRCPWHHACFSLRTGEALRAPALNGLTRFEVGRRGWLPVIVGPSAPPPAPPGPAGAPTSVVILGAGAAGGAAAEMLRRLSYAGSITLVGEDPEPPYDRPNLSKDYLAGSAPEEWIPLRPRSFWEEQRVELVLGERAERIDRERRMLVLASGRELPYGALILATGAEPVVLQLPGMDRPHVHVLRSLADCRAIIARATSAARVAVVGASFIGLEVAASLRERGLPVTVIAPGLVPFERTLGPALGAAFRALHESRGVVFELGHRPARVHDAGVELDDGRVIEGDLVVVGVGVRPRTQLAEAAGLTVDGGVVVDGSMRTSDPAILAAGDIARFPDPHTGEAIRVEHWVVAQRQGQVAARSALGLAARFDAPPFFWTTQYGQSLSYVGHATDWDRMDVHGDPASGDAAVAYRRGDVTLAVATLGRDALSLACEVALEAGDEARLAELVPRR